MPAPDHDRGHWRRRLVNRMALPLIIVHLIFTVLIQDVTVVSWSRSPGVIIQTVRKFECQKMTHHSYSIHYEKDRYNLGLDIEKAFGEKLTIWPGTYLTCCGEQYAVIPLQLSDRWLHEGAPPYLVPGSQSSDFPWCFVAIITAEFILVFALVLCWCCDIPIAFEKSRQSRLPADRCWSCNYPLFISPEPGSPLFDQCPECGKSIEPQQRFARNSLANSTRASDSSSSTVLTPLK